MQRLITFLWKVTGQLQNRFKQFGGCAVGRHKMCCSLLSDALNICADIKYEEGGMNLGYSHVWLSVAQNITENNQNMSLRAILRFLSCLSLLLADQYCDYRRAGFCFRIRFTAKFFIRMLIRLCTRLVIRPFIKLSLKSGFTGGNAVTGPDSVFLAGC